MKTTPIIKTRSILLSAMLLALAAPLAAQDASAGIQSGPAETASPQRVSAQAQAIIDRMTAYLRALPAFSIDSQTTRDEVVAFGYKMQNNESAKLVVKQPNKLRVEVNGDIRNRTFIYDGANFTMYSPDDAVFTRTAAPDSLKKLISGLLKADIEMPLIDVLYQAGQGTLTADVSSGGLVRESRIGGVDCYHLAFRQATLDWQLWVEKGARPLLRKIVITDRFEFGNPQYQSTLRWDLQPKINDSTFLFSAPKGVSEIPFKDAASIKDAAPAGDK